MDHRQIPDEPVILTLTGPAGAGEFVATLLAE